MNDNFNLVKIMGKDCHKHQLHVKCTEIICGNEY